MTNTTRLDLCRDAAYHSNLSQRDCNVALGVMLDTIAASLAEGHAVHLRGLMTMTATRIKARPARDIIRGTVVTVPAQRKVRAVFSEGLLDAGRN